MGKRVIDEAILAPRAGDYGLIDSADQGTGRATILDQVGVGIPGNGAAVVAAIGPGRTTDIDDFDDFDDATGGGWVGIGSTAGGSWGFVPTGAQITPPFPSSGMFGLTVDGTGGASIAIVKPGAAVCIDPTRPIVAEIRFRRPTDNATQAIADDGRCVAKLGFFGVSGADDQIVIIDDTGPQWKVVTTVGGVPTAHNLTLPSGSWGTFRLTVSATGTKVEVSMEGAAYVTLITTTDAPTLCPYVPQLSIEGAGAGDRTMLFDSFRTVGLRAGSQGTAGSIQAFGVPESFPGFGTDHDHAAVGDDGRFSAALGSGGVHPMPRLDEVAAPVSTVSLGSQRMAAAADGIADDDLITKRQLDAAVDGLSTKAPARLATAAAIAAHTYTSGVIAFSSPGSQSVDGVATALGDRILNMGVPGSSSVQFGLYTVTTKGASLVAEVWTRALDQTVDGEFDGARCFVKAGSANASKTFQCYAAEPTIPGTTPIQWDEVEPEQSAGIVHSRVVSGSTDTLTAADLGGVVRYTHASPTVTMPDLSAILPAGADLLLTLVFESAIAAPTLHVTGSVKVDGYALDFTLPTGPRTLRPLSRDGLDWKTGQALTRDRVIAALGSVTSWVDGDSFVTPIDAAGARYPDLSTGSGSTPWDSPAGNIPSTGYTLAKRPALRFLAASALYARRNGGTLADIITAAQDHIWWVGRITAAPPVAALNDSTSIQMIGSDGGTDRGILYGGTSAPYNIRAAYLQTTGPATVDLTMTGVLALNTPLCVESSRKTGTAGLTLRVAGVDGTPVNAPTDMFRLTGGCFVGVSADLATGFQTGETALWVVCNAQIGGDARQMMRDYLAQTYGVAT